MTAAEIRERFLSFFEERGHMRVPSASLVPRVVRPHGAAHNGGDAAVQALLPRRGGAAVAAADLVPEVVPHDRHRERGTHAPAPHVLRDARQLLGRRLLQAGRRGVRLELSTRGLRARPRAASGSRSSAATRSSGSGPTRRRSSAGARSACRTSGSCCSAARTTSGSRARPGPAGRARSSTSTAARTSAPTTDRPGDDTERFLEFWNLVFMQYELQADGSLPELPDQEHRHRAGRSSAWRRSSRTSRPSTRRTSSAR